MKRASSSEPRPVQPPWPRGFWSLFVTQFQGAFNDNAFKFLVTFLVMGLGFSPEQRDRLAPVVGAVFALPFILFSMSGGYLSDRYSKRSVAIGTKIAEVLIMALALAGLALDCFPVMIAAVFLLSTQSAFFGPAKYGLLPEMLPEKRLSWGNGMLSLGTFLAIISGTVVAGQLSEWFRGRQAWSGAILLGLSGLGLLASLGISRVPPADVTRRFRLNIVPEFLGHWRMIRKDRVLFLAIFGDAYFWFLAAILQLSILFYGKEVLALGDAQISYLMAALAIGIGAGSCTAGYLSGQKIEYGLVPLGAIGLTLFSGALSLPGFSYLSVLVILALLGFFGGFYIVPLAALIQHRPEPSHKGSVIATLAVLSFSGVFLASCVYYVLRLGLGLSLPQVFLVCSLLTLAGTVYVLYLLPDSLLRLVLWGVTHSIYRITLEGRDRIPERGGALLVCNHLSLVDALFLLASTDRHIRFVMLKEIYERPWIKPFARMLRAIPISPKQPPRELIQSLQTASNAIQQGQVVCIFAEGQITRLGQMMPFRRGFERIMKQVDAPILPVSLDGVWGSIFSFEQGRFYWKWPRRIPYPVTVSYGNPLPPDTTAFTVRQRVGELNTQAWQQRKPRMQTIHQSFIRTARLHPRRTMMAEAKVPRLSFGAGLTRMIFLARRLRNLWQDQSMIGLSLPPSMGAALANLAALLAGKIPVNLNYTLSQPALRSCLEQCRIRTVLTSRDFLSHLKVAIPGQVVLLEECTARPGPGEKCLAWLLARMCPAGWLERMFRSGKKAQMDDLATVVFSSGSTGDPKGVMLSHFNLMSNVEQLGQVFALEVQDRFLGVLPFFHSFGFTGTLCLPATLGVGVVYHANPLDVRAVGQLVDQHRITYLLAAPTFLQMYTRGCEPEQFGSLRMVIVGAEKLPESLAGKFEDRFGIRPLEAYGCTECAPAVTVNTPDFRAPGVRQVGVKRGTIGHPLPGVSVRVVDPQTLAPLGPNQAGLLLVRGPNVMMGYLGPPEISAAVIQDGWYRTGDIAAIDEDGFLTITDRLSRFSKIGGEMVPHIKVEEHLQQLAGLTEPAFAVTSLPDEKKGERLVVLHTVPDPILATALDKLAQSDLPNLWKPRRDQFFRIEKFPLLGSGKMDWRALREKAVQLSPS